MGLWLERTLVMPVSSWMMICVLRATRALVTVGRPGLDQDRATDADARTQRLVEGIRVQRLGAAKHRRHGLNGCADDIVVRILCVCLNLIPALITARPAQ
jgi:hypothetical protein